jgi:sucrose-6-phosphate hydrolase SacC (GH32 family)
MKWRKLGKIFDPTNSSQFNPGSEYAQSPEVLVFDDFVRIYFSTRKKDESGKYISHIAFIDMDKDFKNILRVSTENVIPLGELGSYNEHGIFPFHVLRDQNRILGYISGWSRRVSVSVETSIGVAESVDNGLTFKKIGNGPVLTSSLKEPFLVCDPFVLKENGSYHMWYIFGLKWINHPEEQDPQRVYKIGHAVSGDGIKWEKSGKQIISDRIDENECQALPTVVRYSDKYYMFFCYRDVAGFRKNSAKAYRIGCAWSKDLETWTRDDAQGGIDVSKEGWDSDMMCYPHAFYIDNKLYMLYNGNEFGRNGFGLALCEEEEIH